MGALFALASGTSDVTRARPDAVASGMRITFGGAAILIVVALAFAVGTYRRTSRPQARATDIEPRPWSDPSASRAGAE